MRELRFMSFNGGSVLTGNSDDDIESAKSDILRFLDSGKKSKEELINGLCEVRSEWSWELSPHYLALTFLVDREGVLWHIDDGGEACYYLPKELVK